MAAPVQHHGPVAMGPYVYQPLGYQQITSLGSATNLTRPGDNAIAALIEVEGTFGTDFVRWRDDGTAPTTSVGMLVNAAGIGASPVQGASTFWYTGDLTAIQFIGSGSPKLNVSYYR
jgi:hypothetical protein